MNSEKKINDQLNALADQSGLAIVTVDENSEVLSASNNNSMCRFLYNSTEFSSSCAEFCGKAFKWASEAESKVEYQCYAGLNCMAVQMRSKRSVAIVGRVFLKSEDYRNATTRAVTGDWKQFPADEFFDNTLFGSSSEDLRKTAKTAADFTDLELLELPPSAVESGTVNLEKRAFEIDMPIAEEPKSSNRQSKAAKVQEIPKSKPQNLKLQEWRSLFGSFMKTDYEQACRLVADFISQIYAVSSFAWLEREGNRLEKIFAGGDLEMSATTLSIAANDERLLEAIKTKNSLEISEQANADDASAPRTLWLFPFVVGGEAQSALIVGSELNDIKKRQITRFCQKIAPQMEILRLRGKLSKSNSIERAIEKFNDSLKTMNAEDFWLQLIAASAELMRAERSSLLIFDEKEEQFTAKAATGIKADFIKSKYKNLGTRVAKNVLDDCEAVVVEDVNKMGWKYALDDG